MENRSLYILAGYDDKTEEILSGIQKKLYDLGYSGVQTKDIPMHFTLGSFDTSMEDELRSRLEKIAEKHKAFNVMFNHIGLFRLPQNDVLFAAPEINKEMLSLRDNFLDNIDTFPWSAHTTFLIDKAEVIHEATSIVMNEFKAFEGKVSRIYLYEFFPARHIMTIELEDS